MPLMLEQRPVVTGKSSATVITEDVDTLIASFANYLDSGETLTGTPTITEEGFLVGTGTVDADNTIALENHSLTVGDIVWTQTAGIGRLLQGRHYYVQAVSGDKITLSTTSGGAVIDIGSSANGKAEIWKYTGASDLTLTAKAVTTTAQEVLGESVAAGLAVEWMMTGQWAGVTYAVRVSCATTGGRTKVVLAPVIAV